MSTGEAESSCGALYWDDIAVGDNVPAIHLDVTSLCAASVPTVTLDQFAAHYDIEIARSIGLEALSLNTMQLMGLANRHATDWSGPGAFIMRQSIKIIRPAYMGYRLTVSGKVAAWEPHPDDPASGCVEIQSHVASQDGDPVIDAAIMLALPRRPPLPA